LGCAAFLLLLAAPHRREIVGVQTPRTPAAMPPLSTLTSRATRAHPTSPRSTGFCALWDCISSSSAPADPPAGALSSSLPGLPVTRMMGETGGSGVGSTAAAGAAASGARATSATVSEAASAALEIPEQTDHQHPILWAAHRPPRRGRILGCASLCGLSSIARSPSTGNL